MEAARLANTVCSPSAKRLKILLVNDYGQASGGAELQMLALRKGLRERGHNVRLLTSDAKLVPGMPNEADVTCRGRTDLAQIATHTVNLGALRAIRREMASFRPDIVHLRMFLWQLSPMVLAPLKNIPVLYQAAVYKAICPNGMKLLPNGRTCHDRAGLVCLKSGCVAPKTWVSTMAQLRLLNRWRSHIDKVAVLSSNMATLFQESGWGPVDVMGNGVDERPVRPPLGGDPIVAYAGRLSREKGIETLLAAFSLISADHPHARLVIAGSGPLEARLREMAEPVKHRVDFLGHLSRPRMEAAFDGAWVQVVPSLWAEPFGNVSTEAMMRGTAVVAADVGGQSDIVRAGKTGYLVPPGDVNALADRLSRILSDRGLAETLSAEGRRVALSEYSRDAVLDRLETAYHETIQSRRVAS